MRHLQFFTWSFLIFCSLISFVSAQTTDWRLFVPDAQHYYYDSGYSKEIYAFTADSVSGKEHYLNHKTGFISDDPNRPLPCKSGDFYRQMSDPVKLNNSHSYWQQHPYYFLPFIYQGDTVYIGKERKSFFLPFASLHQSWKFKHPNYRDTVFFSCIGLEERNIDGITDSVKTYKALMDTSTFLFELSKSYGFLRWHPNPLGYAFNEYDFQRLAFKDSNQYLGRRLPNTEAYFPPAFVGDISVWKYDDFNSMAFPRDSSWNNPIWKNAYTHTIIVDSVTRITRENGETWIWSDQTVTEKHINYDSLIKDTFIVRRDIKRLQFDFKPVSFFEAFPKTIMFPKRGNNIKQICYFINQSDGRTVFEAIPNDVAAYYQPQGCEFQFPIACFLDYQKRYREGIGLVYELYENGPTSWTNKLIGGRRNGFMFGDFKHFNNRNEEGFNSVDFTLYPNPTTGIITVNSPDRALAMGFEYQVVNVLGQEMIPRQKSASLSLDLRALPKGVYLLRLYSNNRFGSAKIIKAE